MTVLGPTDQVDDTYRIVADLLGAADAGTSVTLTPRQCLILAEHLTRKRTRWTPYLEALVDQLGGRVHVDTRFLVRSTAGSRIAYRPDHDAGQGGLLYLRSEPDGKTL